jgi:hypothetical protein
MFGSQTSPAIRILRDRRTFLVTESKNDQLNSRGESNKRIEIKAPRFDPLRSMQVATVPRLRDICRLCIIPILADGPSNVNLKTICAPRDLETRSGTRRFPTCCLRDDPAADKTLSLHKTFPFLSLCCAWRSNKCRAGCAGRFFSSAKRVHRPGCRAAFSWYNCKVRGGVRSSEAFSTLSAFLVEGRRYLALARH